MFIGLRGPQKRKFRREEELGLWHHLYKSLSFTDISRALQVIQKQVNERLGQLHS